MSLLRWCLCLALLGALSKVCGAQANPAAVPQDHALASIAAKVVAALFAPGSHKARPDATYDATLGPVMALRDAWLRHPDPWVRVGPAPWGKGWERALVILNSALRELGQLAPTTEARISATRDRERIALRLISSPRAAQLLAGQGPATEEGSDYDFLLATRGWLLPGARNWRRSDGDLPPGEWGVLVGTQWSVSPRDVLRKGDVTYVSTDLLRRGGVGGTVLSSGVRLSTAHRQAVGLAPCVRQGPAGAPAGAVWVPVTALKSDQLCAVDSYREEQMVVITPVVPEVRPTKRP